MIIAVDLDGTLGRFPNELLALLQPHLRNARVLVLTAAAGELPKHLRPAEVRRRLDKLGLQQLIDVVCLESSEKGEFCARNKVDFLIDDDTNVVSLVKSQSPSTICLQIK